LDRDNPFREDSDVDLSETKNEYRWIETESLKMLMKSGLSGSEWSVFFYILHRNRGYCNSKSKIHRHTDDISIEMIQEYTGLTENTVYRVLGSLKKKQMIYTVKRGREVKTGVNFRYDTWNLNLN
jgi:DNA-binding MarR family transcriptional regulator